MMTAFPPALLETAEAQVHPSAFPISVDIVPGALQARVYLHTIEAESGSVQCWSFVTAGLARLRQKDVVFTVAVEPGADPGRFPTDPLRFSHTLFGLATQGRLVDNGDISELGGSGFMGWRGVTYASSQPLNGVPIPSGTLAVVPLSAEELEVLKVGGQTRVLSALGHAHRYYPFPPWRDRRRGSVISPRSTEGTILARVPHMPTAGTACMRRNTVLLRLRGEARTKLAQAFATLPRNAGFALTVEVDPTANGCLVWQSGQSAPAAITPPGSRGECLSGCFVLVVPEQREDGGQVFEDGFAFLLTNTCAARLRNALCSGQSFALPGAGAGMGLTLEWGPTI